MWAALRAIGRARAAPRGEEPRARPAGAGVSSGWIGPDGRVEEAPGTAVHVALLARFGEPTKDGFFAKGAVRYVDATDHVSLELVGNHPVALSNAIEALTRRWAQVPDVDMEFLAPPEVLRASSVEVRRALGRRLRTLQGEPVDIQARKNAGRESTVPADGTVRAFQQTIVARAQQKLGRPLTAKEHAFITTRGGFLALETIRDTVEAATASELEAYLNSG
jgi:hypothetical protein